MKDLVIRMTILLSKYYLASHSGMSLHEEATLNYSLLVHHDYCIALHLLVLARIGLVAFLATC